MLHHRVVGTTSWLGICFALACAAPSSDTGARRNSSANTPGAGAPAGGPNGFASAVLPQSSPVVRGGSQGEEICASTVVSTMKNMPTVVFVIDGSGSMCAPFGMSTRWQALRYALLDPSAGFIYRLQDAVRFGATLYDGTIDTNLAAGAALSVTQNPPCALLSSVLLGKNAGMCPLLLESLPAKLNNAGAIDMVFPMTELGGSTPTDRALSHVVDVLIPTVGQQTPDGPPQGPIYMILATDGAPNDICVGGVGGDGLAQQQGVIAAVDRAAAADITTWVISLADGDPALEAHLDEVARHGDKKNPQARTFSPTNPDELLMTLAQLLGGAVGCHIALNGTVGTGQECLGTVEQNGQALSCCEMDASGAMRCDGTPSASPNGWRLSDPHSVELLGDACAKFLLGSGASLLTARFPCAVFTPS
jgi:Mg-chelatase subunit ChlD